MKTVRIVNATRGGVICEQCQVADKMWPRFMGLMGRASLPEKEGILLAPGGSIHMFWMKFSIDVIFLTRDDVVTDVVHRIPPGKTYIAKNGAGKPYAALEIAEGMIEKTGVQVGDKISREELGVQVAKTNR